MNGIEIRHTALAACFAFACIGLLATGAAAQTAETSSVDINTADVAELSTIRGIGKKTAQSIIAHRDAHGPFASVDGLTAVKGIGPKSIEKLRPFLTAGNGAPSPKAEARSDEKTDADVKVARPPDQQQAGGDYTFDLTKGADLPPPAPLEKAPPPAADVAGRININTASAAKLTGLRGIGKSKADAIVAEREANGPFAKPADLTRVRGIGHGTVDKNADLIAVE